MKTHKHTGRSQTSRRVARGSMQRRVRATGSMVGKFATLTEDIKSHFLGQWWLKGETVKVIGQFGDTCCISKHPRKSSGLLKEGLPIINELAGVPKALLRCSNDPDQRPGGKPLKI